MASELTDAEKAERKKLKPLMFLLAYKPPREWTREEAAAFVRYEDLTAKAMGSSQGLLLA